MNGAIHRAMLYTCRSRVYQVNEIKPISRPCLRGRGATEMKSELLNYMCKVNVEMQKETISTKVSLNGAAHSFGAVAGAVATAEP